MTHRDEVYYLKGYIQMKKKNYKPSYTVALVYAYFSQLSR